MIKVNNIINSNNNPVLNQFEIRGVTAGTFYKGDRKLRSGDCFQSYSSIIVYKTFDGDVYLDEHFWNYSRTTSKYRNIFLGENTADTRKKIKSGEYKLINLN